MENRCDAWSVGRIAEQRRQMGCLRQGTVCCGDSTTEKEQQDRVEFPLTNRFQLLPYERLVIYLPVEVRKHLHLWWPPPKISPERSVL